MAAIPMTHFSYTERESDTPISGEKKPNDSRFSMNYGAVQKGLIFGGAVFLAFSLVLGFGGLQTIIEFTVTKMMQLIPDSHLWNIWKEIPIPIYFNLYLFNITNPEEMSTGAKPVLEELGPYVYLLKLKKVNITVNESEDTIKYRQIRTLYFQPEMSEGSEDDVVTYINILFVVVANMAHGFTDIDFILKTLDDILTGKGETLTKSNTMRELVFDGVSIQPYVDLINDPMTQAAAGDVSLPEKYADGMFAIFKGFNESDDGWWEVKSGIKNSSDLARVVSVNGKTQLDIWKADSCNALNGTGGELYPPFIIPKETRLQIFVPDLCQSILWIYQNETVTKGIHTSRFISQDLKSVNDDSDSWCFCPLNDTMECNVTGIRSLAPCFDGAPMMFSKPHFLYTDTSVASGVEGLFPDPSKHDSWIDVHAYTGSTIQAFIRFQLSVELMNWPAMPTFSNASKAMIPFAWFEQTATLDDENISQLKYLQSIQYCWPILRWIMISVALVIISSGITFSMERRKEEI